LLTAVSSAWKGFRIFLTSPTWDLFFPAWTTLTFGPGGPNEAINQPAAAARLKKQQYRSR